MKLTILQENLNQTVSILIKAIPSKPSLPILSSIKISAQSAVCSACSTDLYFGIDTNMVADVQEHGTVVVPGKQFKEIISSLSAGPLTLEYADGTLIINSGKSITTLQCQPAGEYPPFPEIVGPRFSISSTQLSNLNTLVQFSASTDVARPVLTSMYLNFTEERKRVVATDGFRLSVLDLSEGIELNEPLSVLIPAKAIMEVARLAEQRSVEIIHCIVSDELKQARFDVGDVAFYVRLIEGAYPPYEKIIPGDPTTIVQFDSSELQTNVKRAMVFARESSNIIKFKITKGSVVLSATSALVGTYEGALENSTVVGQEIELAFNAKYIQEFLAAISGDAVQMEMTEPLKPIRLRSAENPGYQYIVMPFKVSGS